jgi:sterol desaturase/sphingolipid hydroxylase (fatty acid hydroxylase superfamily)
MTWDWKAGLAFVGVLVAISLVGRFAVFEVPAFAEARASNRRVDRQKLSRKSYRAVVKVNNQTGLGMTVAFYAGVLPFFICLDARPIWRHVVDVLAVLLIYDFFYYLTHRFLFHGRLLRRIHALHHQARTPTYIDALYVHPVETAIGLLIFFGTIPLWAIVTGGPLHAVSIATCAAVFTYLNQINHTWTSLPRFPYRTVDAITSLHAAHHIDMNHGNYATITMLYDWLFGTLEAPAHRTAP